MSYKFNSIVNKQEADALKDMIFKRARERAEILNNNEQSDVMNLARDSFESKNNPFSDIIEQTKNNIQTKQNTEKIETTASNQEPEIGFPLKKRENKIQATRQAEIVKSEIENNMIHARESLNNKQSFMGALNFLNSQAAVSLIRTRADKFEIIV